MTELILLPHPQSLTRHGGSLNLSAGKLIAIPGAAHLFAARRLQTALAALGFHWEIVAESAALPADQIGVQLRLAPTGGSASGKPDAYTLEIAANGVEIIGLEPAALWNGVCTLLQILAQSGASLPLLSIADWPDFSRRGVMLDISRDKVPSMETLYALVDRLAGWKINELQLYTEHTFAYRQHQAVWANASPMTGEQILELDGFCRERHIDLVPNQNSFGHMHRWLIHDRYRPLAEVPDGLDWPIFLSPRPFSLAATDPGSLELIGSLYTELLPHFSSRHFNVGCDETFDLGQGRSRELAEARGKGRVYLDFLKQIHNLVQRHDRTMLFWGDIIMQHPDLVPELPRDAIALEWGYDADHPFDQDGARFTEAGIKFYVCPGTSSWLSLIGRTQNMLGNLRNAALNGKKHGAVGYLNTDWGDFGHMQPLPVSYLGFAYGAALSWAVEPNLDLDLPAALDKFAFEDPSGTMGKLAYDLGNAYLKLDDQRHRNGAAMVRSLYFPLEKIPGQKWLTSPIDPGKVRAAIAEADRLSVRLDEAWPADPLVVPEYRLAVALWRHGCVRLLMAAGDTTFDKRELAAEIQNLINEYSERWLARNRPGGLEDSLTRLRRLLAEYEM